MNTVTEWLTAIGVRRPTLILDRKKVMHNIEQMVHRSQAAGVRLRPHFKTHQSVEVGRWFRRFGVEEITVSSVEMANYFARDGWRDITIAFPVNLLEIEAINTLAQSLVLNLLVDSLPTVEFLCTHITHEVRIWLKVDVGYRRVGLNWQEIGQMHQLIERMESVSFLRVTGLLAHFGHSYHASNQEEIREVYHSSLSRLLHVKTELESRGIPELEVSIGDTPCCSLMERFEGVDEIRPGNFVFYDLNQNRLGACGEEEIALAVACPVVGKYPQRKQIAIYGGAVHFSRDALEQNSKIFGILAAWKGDHWQGADPRGKLAALSQEHGILQVDESLFQEINPGDLVLILPVHSCLTANLFKEYLTLEGKRILRFQSLA